MHTLMLRGRSEASGLRTRGFSLVEVAISLAVVAVLMTGILVPVVTQIGQRKVAVTEKTLDDVRNALLGFAAAHGRLPCPALNDGVTYKSGDEAFAKTSGTPVNGSCESFSGFVPGRTLGITPVDQAGYVLDGWGAGEHNRVRYAISVDTVKGVTNPFTKADGMRTVTIAEVAKVNSLLHVCDSGTGVDPGVSCGTAKTLTSTAVAVIWSVGPNAVSGGITTDEAQNPNPNPKAPPSADRIFVSRIQSDAAGNPFDDVVTWLSFNTLVNRMVAAGQLP